ncbi:hypothetical protein X777_13777 [Ooceraea biroi]|uniref:Tudor domain-containing protein n=1 Tax=Ooceraea biroi TaxID=2015173 RepID=A0A026W026_OOCBI|nr:hypothetical protein X777_13777 [Ooceraea biroi]
MEIKEIDTTLLTRRPLAVTIIRVDSPSLIWLHIKNSQLDYQEMREDQVMMQRRAKYLGCYPDQIERNQVIAIRDETRWHRGCITSIEGDLARIVLKDWGRNILCPLHECHRLPVRLQELSWQAVPCNLFRVSSTRSSNIWSFETRQMVKALAEYKNGKIKIRKGSSESALVDLIIDNHPDEGYYDVKNILIKMGYVQPASNNFKSDMYPGLTRSYRNQSYLNSDIKKLRK